MKRSRPLQPALESEPIPSFKQVATALAAGALSLSSATAAAGEPLPQSPVDLLEHARKDAPSPVGEASQRGARALYEAAEQRFAEGQPEAAAVEILLSYRLDPSPRVLPLLARIYEEHGDVLSAIVILTYFDDVADQAPPAQRAEIQAHIAALRARAASLTIEVDVPGAEVRLDGNTLPADLTGTAIPVQPGAHEILALHGPSMRGRRLVELAPGTSTTIAIHLETVPDVAIIDRPTGGVPPPPLMPHGMCACDVPGGGSDASIPELAAVAAAILASRRRRR